MLVLSRGKRLFSSLAEERIAYRLVLSFALMGIIPMLLTIYLIAVIWLPDLNTWTQITVVLLLSLSATILGFLLSRTAVYTILRTVKTATEIADGDFSKRIEIEGDRSEISPLVESFNKITARLEEKIKELETSEDKYRRLVENVPDLLYYIDPEGRVTSVNKEVKALLGYRKEEILDRHLSTLIHPEDYKTYEPTLRERRMKHSRFVKRLRVRFQAKDGETRTLEVNSRGIYDEAGTFLGTECLGRDITAQLALEREREEFLYMLTHDIRNPISAILFITNMLRDGTIAADAYQEYYDKIEKACNGAVKLVEDFLEYKKLQIGNVTLKKSKVNLTRLIVDIARTYDSRARTEGKQITVYGGSTAAATRNARAFYVLADCTYLQRAVENLVTNAIKFSNKTVDITCVETAEGIALMVQDDGPGIADSEKEDIFKLFHTSAGNRTAKGIGVGLASVRMIVQAHGGKISVDHGADGGCIFKITLAPETATSDPRSEVQPGHHLASTAHA